jgi:SsrA-binding protein
MATRDDKPRTPRILNRKARHEYHISQVLEAGLLLAGTEVKSLRAGQAKIDEAFARIRGGELWLVGMNIAAYPQAAPGMQHDPTRDRKLLAHRRQIAVLEAHARQKGNTIVPIAVYFKDGWAKVELGLAVGKQHFDKRQDLKKKQANRDIQREMRRRQR